MERLNTYFGAQYGFRDKYFGTLNAALDGSSRLERKHQRRLDGWREISLDVFGGRRLADLF